MLGLNENRTTNLLKLVFLSILILSPFGVDGQDPKAFSEDSMIPPEYTKTVPVKDKDNLVTILLQFFPVGIGEVSLFQMTFELQFYLILTWQDYRLALHNHVGRHMLSEATAKKIWTPLLEYRNCMNCDPITFNPETHFIVVVNKSLAFYSLESAKLHCDFDLSNYPLDVQRCGVEIQGNKKWLLLENSKIQNFDKGTTMEVKNPPQYTITKIGRDNCNVLNSMDATFRCMEFYFVLERRLTFHLLITFIPSILLVLLAWCTFWMDVDAVIPRLTLCITALVCLIVMYMTKERDVPPVSYIKAMDVWFFFCILLVVVALVEFSFANYYHRIKNKNRILSATPIPTAVPRSYVFPAESVIPIRTPEDQSEKKLLPVPKVVTRTSPIDKWARIVYLVVFILFNIIFWSVYLTRY